MKLLIYTSLLGLTIQTFGSTKFELNETALKKISEKGSPQLDQIHAASLAVDLQSAQTKEQFAPELFGSASYSETNERAILQFIPVWSPVKQAQVGVRQNLNRGFSAEASATTTQQSATSSTGRYKDITTTSLNFTMQMDLWRDLFGRMSTATLEIAQFESKRASLEKDINSKSFLLSLRRVYWSLVATEESIKISQEMLRISRKQLDEAKQRFRNSVAEVDEVARNEAQVASKQATLTFYEVQRENSIKQLKNLLPELADQKIVLAPYDLAKTVETVTACTASIALETKVPYQYTFYDEATDLLRKVKGLNARYNSRYADPDLKLYGKVKATGIGSEDTGSSSFRGSYGSSIDDIENTNRTGYEVGLRVSIPLGDAKAHTQRTKELYDEKRLLASIQAADIQVINTHQQLTQTIRLLNDVIKAQKLNSRELAKRLKYMERKYQQARVSINDLIQDQDALLRADLTTIETQLQMLNVLFDYLAIFTETPCSFNRI